MIKYCLPIIAHSKEDVFKAITDASSDYDFFEVWLDYIKDFKQEFLSALAAQYPGRIIFLLRRLNLESEKLSEKEQHAIIDYLAGQDSILDLDLRAQSSLLEYLLSTKKEFKKIVSFHNYDSTPPLDQLKAVVSEMERFKPWVYKVATYCNSEKDLIELLKLTIDLKEKQLDYIVLGMGKFGVATRIMSPLLGNKMIFAPKSLDAKSADGQISLHQLEGLFKELKIDEK